MAGDPYGQPVRSLVLWLPDWPVTALTRGGDGGGGARDGGGGAGETSTGEGSGGGSSGGGASGGGEGSGGDVAPPRAPSSTREAPPALDPSLPIAVMERNAVVACSAAARAEGVRRGQRRRDAQSRCPRLIVVSADAARDHRVFAPLVARIEERAPGVQIVRPGLCALKARGPARYYGGEHEAAVVLLEALRAQGIDDARAAIADGPFTAEQAARIATTAARPIHVVPPGAAAPFLAPLSIATLDDPALAGGAEIVGLLARLGVQTLGDFAALAPDRVHERFGARGIRLHALAAGRDSSAVDPRTPPPELQREVAFEPPLEIADQVAFGMRIAADEFLARLGAEKLVCTELRVLLVGEQGERSERVWLHPASFDAAAVVDRVRWQLGEAQGDGGLRSGVSLVRIEPAAVDAASHHTPTIFGSGPEERVHHALSRVQAMLGHRGVLTSAIGGGRWLAERQVLVPWGDRVVLAKERARPWPGSLPDPLPTTVFAEPFAVELASADGASVTVDERGAPSAVPTVIVEGGRRRAVTAWAGPWPVIERGWDAVRRRRAHRFQVVDADQTAWLLVCEDGAWQAEARYD